jgi:hypothetical protein
MSEIMSFLPVSPSFFLRLQKNSTSAGLTGSAVWPPVWSIATASIVAHTVTVFDANAWVNV